jgi:hypothetical protein
MSIFGLTDPWVIGAYVGCFLTVAFCIAYSILKGKESDEGDETDE